MQGFDHPAAHRNHRWNLAEAGQHRDKISLVEDPEKQALLAWGFDAWERVKNDLKSLQWQFIHGDMNRENILVRGDRVTGLVDFGIRPLTEAELSVLLPLVCGRLATSIAVSISRRRIDPDNPNWFGSEESAWDLLVTLRDEQD